MEKWTEEAAAERAADELAKGETIFDVAEDCARGGDWRGLVCQWQAAHAANNEALKFGHDERDEGANRYLVSINTYWQRLEDRLDRLIIDRLRTDPPSRADDFQAAMIWLSAQGAPEPLFEVAGLPIERGEDAAREWLSSH